MVKRSSYFIITTSFLMGINLFQTGCKKPGGSSDGSSSEVKGTYSAEYANKEVYLVGGSMEDNFISCNLDDNSCKVVKEASEATKFKMLLHKIRVLHVKGMMEDAYQFQVLGENLCLNKYDEGINVGLKKCNNTEEKERRNHEYWTISASRKSIAVPPGSYIWNDCELTFKASRELICDRGFVRSHPDSSNWVIRNATGHRCSCPSVPNAKYLIGGDNQDLFVSCDTTTNACIGTYDGNKATPFDVPIDFGGRTGGQIRVKNTSLCLNREGNTTNINLHECEPKQDADNQNEIWWEGTILGSKKNLHTKLRGNPFRSTECQLIWTGNGKNLKCDRDFMTFSANWKRLWTFKNEIGNRCECR